MEVSTITNFRIKNRPTSTPLLSSLAASPNTTQNIAIAKLLDENRPKTIARATRSNNIFRELVKERKMSQILVNDTKDKIAKMDLDATTPNVTRIGFH